MTHKTMLKNYITIQQDTKQQHTIQNNIVIVQYNIIRLKTMFQYTNNIVTVQNNIIRHKTSL